MDDQRQPDDDATVEEVQSIEEQAHALAPKVYEALNKGSIPNTGAAWIAMALIITNSVVDHCLKHPQFTTAQHKEYITEYLDYLREVMVDASHQMVDMERLPPKTKLN